MIDILLLSTKQTHMNNRIIVVSGILVLVTALSLFVFHEQASGNLKRESNFEVAYQSISGIMRASLGAIYAQNDTVVAGDEVGGISIWSYDEKKNKLNFQDNSREVVPILPDPNKVVALDGLAEGIIALTADGKLTSYAVNSASKITGKASFNVSQTFSEFILIGQKNFATISSNRHDICIYSINDTITRPNPITKLSCNTSTTNLSGLSYDPVNSVLAAGDSTKAIIYKVNVSDSNAPVQYLSEANLPKAEVKGFDSSFTKNGTLIVVNDLWVCTVIIDMATPSAKVLSSDRTEKLVKSGETSAVTVGVDTKNRINTVIFNARNIMKGYTVGTNNKLSYKSDSRALGRPQNFVLVHDYLLFSTKGIDVYATELSDNSTDYFTIKDQQPIASNNHFAPVNKVAHYNGTVVTVSEGGEGNLKLWKLDNFSLTLADQKTISYFSILKAGIIDLKSLLILPPQSKQNVNVSMLIVTAGNDPFELIIATVNTQGKIGQVSKSKDSHFSNITSIFVTPDFKKIITSSMDTLLKIWNLGANRETVDNDTEVVTTKYGPIKNGLQDKSGKYYVYDHCMTDSSSKVNITIWTTDTKKGLVKVAENVPSEAHESNLTALLFSKDEKYIISMSESGQLRLWQHKDFTVVDLLASLSIGQTNLSLEVTDSNKLLIQSDKEFIQYSFDFNGFVLEGRSSKKYSTNPSTMLGLGDKIISGDADGAIRSYQLSE